MRRWYVEKAGETGMPAEEVAILADDLTGALDAAAPFARPGHPVAVVWGERAPPAAPFALDSESRELPPRRAETLVARLIPHLAGRPLALKKVDSLLRGNSLAEVAACWKSGLFQSLVLAPAFPAQGRVTRNATQFAKMQGAWQPVAADLVAALAAHGVAAEAAPAHAAITGQGAFVCDAETEDDLSSIAQAGRHVAGPVLWCGSAGLARALAAGREPVAVEGRRRLVIVGSRHPVAATQAARLAAAHPHSVATLASLTDTEAAASRVRSLLDRTGMAALVFRLPPLAPAEAAALMVRTFAALAQLEPPDVLVVTGGETLLRLCAALGASRVDVLGEWQPGIPVARIADGAWGGCVLVSKSGAFGTDDVLAALACPDGAVAF
jgi:uncharacterized protein YgbK (DUF1537 family)